MFLSFERNLIVYELSRLSSAYRDFFDDLQSSGRMDIFILPTNYTHKS